MWKVAKAITKDTEGSLLRAEMKAGTTNAAPLTATTIAVPSTKPITVFFVIFWRN